MVTLGAIKFSVVAGDRTPQCAPRRLGALATGNINGFLTSGDSVNVPSIDDMGCPSFDGRIIDVARCLNEVPSDDALHPFTRSLDFRHNNNEVLKIQLHIKNDQAFGADAELEEVDPKVWVDLINLNEAAPNELCSVGICSSDTGCCFLHSCQRL